MYWREDELRPFRPQPDRRVARRGYLVTPDYEARAVAATGLGDEAVFRRANTKHPAKCLEVSRSSSTWM